MLVLKIHVLGIALFVFGMLIAYLNVGLHWNYMAVESFSTMYLLLVKLKT